MTSQDGSRAAFSNALGPSKRVISHVRFGCSRRVGDQAETEVHRKTAREDIIDRNVSKSIL